VRWPVALLLLLLAACTPPRPSCDLAVVSQMPLQVKSRLLTVPVGINEKWVRLIVDSGAERTTLSREAADRLGLKRDPKRVMTSSGMGGSSTNADAIVDRFFLGGTNMPIDRVAVGELPLAELGVDGLLGADILLAFEMDIDVPGGALSLYRVRMCAGTAPPWKEPFAEVQGVAARRDRLLIPFYLNGAEGRAILDTGAQATTVSLDMAKRAGVNEKTLANDRVVHHRGAGAGSTAAFLHRFDSIRIGPATIDHPVLSVISRDAGIGDALVGEDFLQGRRVWMSFPTRQFFVSLLSHEMTGMR
jgi:predicted aspartyl protease